jgi:hypothetical protein
VEVLNIGCLIGGRFKGGGGHCSIILSKFKGEIVFFFLDLLSIIKSKMKSF